MLLYMHNVNYTAIGETILLLHFLLPPYLSSQLLLVKSRLAEVLELTYFPNERTTSVFHTKSHFLRLNDRGDINFIQPT